MGDLPFHMDWIRALADARIDWLTRVFQLFTVLGDLGGYVLVITLVYVAWDKRLALQLAVLALATMLLNHVLKMLIANPRPFVADGAWLESWAVSPATAQSLATEFSTPSGHAMVGAAFYVFLYASVKNRAVRGASVLLILLTGASRPYLGVHYVEDVLIGWVLGSAIALLAFRRVEIIGERWGRLSQQRQVLAVAAASLALWILTRSLAGWSTPEAGQPLAFVSYTGFLMGIVIAHPLEAAHVGFDPRSGTLLHKLLRWALCVALVLGTLAGLDQAFDAISEDHSLLGQTLRYVRYAAAGFAGMYLAPLVCVKLGLAASAPEAPAPRRLAATPESAA